MYYHRTSGTVGAAKNIPVTASGLKRMKQDQRVAAYVWSRSTSVLKGKAFAVTGQAVEGRMEGGSPYGSASGLLYRGQSRLVRSHYVLPAETADIEDYEARYVAMAVYGLSEEGVTGVATANPSTFLRLLTVAEEHAEEVLEAIASGRMPAGGSYPARGGTGAEAAPGPRRVPCGAAQGAGALQLRGHLAPPDGDGDVDGRELRGCTARPVGAPAAGNGDHRAGVPGERVPGDGQHRRAEQRVPAKPVPDLLRVRRAGRVGGGGPRRSRASTSWSTAASTTCS